MKLTTIGNIKVYSMAVLIAAFSFTEISVAQDEAICHKYIVKVSKQLELCHGAIKDCFHAPFKHALDSKNYGGKYSGCQTAFDQEVAQRLNGKSSYQSLADMSSEATVDPKLPATPPNLLIPKAPEVKGVAVVTGLTTPEASNVTGDCQPAFHFLKYVTQSCLSGSCVERQYQNTIKIPAFSNCRSSLISAKNTKKASLPEYPSYNPWVPTKTLAH